MFAGSGSLGIEALSRYAEYCHFCELNPQAGKLIRDNLATLGLDQDKYRVELGNGLEKISTCNDPFDVIFIDPPFNQNLAEKAISMIVNGHLLKVGGVLYVETELNASLASLPASWHCIKQRHTKTMSYCLYTHAT
jgi:16S rRNA (guanine966-N2)-methyltransferase